MHLLFDFLLFAGNLFPQSLRKSAERLQVLNSKAFLSEKWYIWRMDSTWQLREPPCQSLIPNRRIFIVLWWDGNRRFFETLYTQFQRSQIYANCYNFTVIELVSNQKFFAPLALTNLSRLANCEWSSLLIEQLRQFGEGWVFGLHIFFCHETREEFRQAVLWLLTALCNGIQQPFRHIQYIT